jgi:hypothetical protein
MAPDDQAYDESVGPSNPKGLLHHLLRSEEGPLWQEIRELSEDEYEAYQNRVKLRMAAA